MRGYNLFVVLITALVVSQLDSTLAIQCYSCSATESGSDCLMKPNEQIAVDCTTDCYTSVDGKGGITRGCLATGTPCSSPNCSSCNSDKCNVNLVCQQCLGLAECGQTNVTAVSYNAVCSTSQICVNQANDNGTVSRQCGAACAAGVADTTCASCPTSLCNTGLFPANRQQCYSCTGAECNTVAQSMIVGCSATDAKCFVTGSAANNMTRGCTSATDGITCAADSTDPSCSICDSSLCNALAYERDAGSCIVCDECPAQQDAATAAKTCGQALYNQTIGCYSSISGTTVKRGCLKDYVGDCTAANSCTSCSETNCNVAAEDFKCIACISNEVADCWEAKTPNDLPLVSCPAGICFSGVWNGLGVRDCFTAASTLMQYQCDIKLEPHQCEECKESRCNSKAFNGAASLSRMGVVGLLMALVIALRTAL
ncbi:protein psiQ [Drosophila ficusphila]|uniref:protein psiQ n=1 Tax=Drosophila ficusphila TaxID=30025 RepID=UPI0007E86522|nr:protein psiQ [Drosophila ficusphila]